MDFDPSMQDSEKQCFLDWVEKEANRQFEESIDTLIGESKLSPDGVGILEDDGSITFRSRLKPQ